MKSPLYDRVLLKLSGEILAGEKSFGIDPNQAKYLADEIASIYKLGIGIGLIIGAGNIFRGIKASDQGMDRVTGDYLGMLATIMNAISLQDALEKINCQTRTLSAINVSQISEPYIRRKAIRHIEKGRIVIIAGGTGNPFFTTDSAASLRATELGADVVIKGTKVDGIYDKDPIMHKNAKKFKKLSYSDVIRKDLKVMDLTAITLCKENNIPIRVFNVKEKGQLKKLIFNNNIGTLVSE